MAKHRRSGGRHSRLGSLGGIRGIATKAAAGIGGATLAAMLANQFAPQFAGFARPAGAYLLGGGVPGVIADMVVSGGLGELFGGNSGRGGGTESV